MLGLDRVNLDDLGEALSEQADADFQWLIDPDTGEIHVWTLDAGLDGQGPDGSDPDDTDLIAIDPLPTRVWYQDMADFADGVSDGQASRRLARAIRGRGAFRHFKDELYEEYPDLVPVWFAFRDVRARRRAVTWLLDRGLVDRGEAERYLAANPDPDLP